MNLYKKVTTKPYSFLVIDTTIASFNKESFRKNIKKLIVIIDGKITNEKR